MIPEKKKRVVAVFAIIYIFFGIAIAYLLLFNTGITVEEQPNPSTGRTNLVIGNKSSHLIYNIAIGYTLEDGTRKEITKIFKLAPGDQENVSLMDLPSSLEMVDIYAEAPFHVPVLKKTALKSARAIQLQIKLSGASTGFVKMPLPLSLEVCNQGDPVSNIVIEESHDATFFTQSSEPKEIETLIFEECETIMFTFTPDKAGQTKIYFNINAYDTTQRVEKDIFVEEMQVPFG